VTEHNHEAALFALQEFSERSVSLDLLKPQAWYVSGVTRRCCLGLMVANTGQQISVGAAFQDEPDKLSTFWFSRFQRIFIR